MGLQTQCPLCGVVFVIPHVQVQPQAAPVYPQYPQHQAAPPYEAAPYQQPYQPQPQYAPQPEPEPQPAPQQELRPLVSDLSEEIAEKGMPLPPEDIAPGVVHIPCPNGHELETPIEMIGEEVLCPHCGVQFKLRNEDSKEYHVQQESLEQRRAQFWLNWAIAASVIVGLGLLTMLIMMVMRS
jgi:hypothetical protein